MIGHTDLAVEMYDGISQSGVVDGVEMKQKNYHPSDIEETVITVTNQTAEELLKKRQGTYITLSSRCFSKLDPDYHRPMSLILGTHLRKLLSEKNDILVVGLGNEKNCADSLGSLVASQVFKTRHFIEQGMLKTGKKLSAFSPGVMAQTGLATELIVEGIVNVIKPDVVIAVDSLAANEINHLHHTIQIADSGIVPGSGVGNHQKEISYDTLGIPVIAIGVPTVIAMSSVLAESDYRKMDEEMIVMPHNSDIAIRTMSYTISEAINSVLGLDERMLAYIK